LRAKAGEDEGVQTVGLGQPAGRFHHDTLGLEVDGAAHERIHALLVIVDLPHLTRRPHCDVERRLGDLDPHRQLVHEHTSSAPRLHPSL
jgi:hypothetical protein